MSQQHYCWDTCQISERSNNSMHRYHGFKAWQYLVIRCLNRYWNNLVTWVPGMSLNLNHQVTILNSSHIDMLLILYHNQPMMENINGVYLIINGYSMVIQTPTSQKDQSQYSYHLVIKWDHNRNLHPLSCFKAMSQWPRVCETVFLHNKVMACTEESCYKCLFSAKYTQTF